MLSNDLRGLKIWFDQLIDGHELTLEGAKAFSSELRSAIDKATALEGNVVPLDKRTLAAAGDNVIVLPVLRRERFPEDAA